MDNRTTPLHLYHCIYCLHAFFLLTVQGIDEYSSCQSSTPVVVMDKSHARIDYEALYRVYLQDAYIIGWLAI